jgi:phenylpropionate dioxygenase-like ring-hydroxylating dioxygenase large terminal subunit
VTAADGSTKLHGLLQAVLAGRDQPLEQAATLPPEVYASEPFYQLEVERVLRPAWLPVGHVAQLASVGDYLCHDLCGEMLLVMRGSERLRVLSRVCLHRWAELLRGSGNCRRFACPAHKWTYDLDGRLIGAPAMDQVAFDPRQQRLPEYRSEIVDGFIYVNLSGDAPALAPQLQELSRELQPLAPEHWRIGATLEYDCPVNWKLIVETFSECYHHIGAHPETFDATYPGRDSYVEEGRAAWTVLHAPARRDVPEDRLTAGFPLLGEMTAQQRQEFRVYLIYPYQLLAVMPDRVYWFCLQPGAAMRTRFQAHLLLDPRALEDPNYSRLIEAERSFYVRFNDEDIAINRMQQRGVATGAARPGRFSHLEKALWQFANYLRQRLDTRAPRAHIEVAR